jgi:glyoxylase-like metal-dependent hydrolase (beta-lactamase superfamily II)
MTDVTTGRLLDRRAFLADLGRGALAIAVVGLAGCAPSGSAASPPRPTAGGSTRAGASPSPGTTGRSDPSGPPSAETSGLAWTRVNLGFVSAYILVRAGEAAVVDTGVAGSAGEVEAALGSVGLEWGSVGHVIVTHHHGDHAGSLADILAAATDAIGYAGAADIPSIQAPRPLTAVGDGDRVFELDVVATPGHTAGHIAVLDATAGVLVAGDALNTQGGTLGGSPPQFTADMDAARASVAKLAALPFETLLVGHGEPIEGAASEAVAELAAAGT